MRLIETLLFEPSHFSVPAPWAGHLPFAHWITGVHRPSSFVELGAYSGISYMAFCQAVMQHHLDTRCWAIDTWAGDPHAGFYGEHIYTTLRDRHEPLYGHFSTLLRSTFDEAVHQFDDHSIDLLHIDGLHTYEAVKHDFETWLPKLSERGVVLFHDSNVFQADFGVHRLWSELEGSYPCINFLHSNGLGVLLVGPRQTPELLDLCAPAQKERYRRSFAKLGARFEERASRMVQESLLKDTQTLLTRETQAGQQRHEWIEKQDATIRSMSLQLSSAQQDLSHAQLQLDHFEQQLGRSERELAAAQHQLNSTQQALQCSLNDQSVVKTELQAAHDELQRLYHSRSWRLTAPLRLLKQGASPVRQISTNLGKGFAYLARGDWQGLFQRLKAIRRERRQFAMMRERLEAKRSPRFGIMTPPHTRFLADQIAQRLRHHGWEAEVMGETRGSLDADLYFVLGAQTFKNLPPGERRIVFQLEQGVSSRWFTPAYIELLNHSFAVLDYNLHNIEFLAGHGIQYPHVFYLPVGGSTAFSEDLDRSPAVDVIFYGDSFSSPRRRALLDVLQQHFKVDVVNDLFGPALYERIRRARVAINLHYYENALLETPRIHECLSLGVPVVSECASNQNEFPHLGSVVRFFETGNAESMVQAVHEMLASPPGSKAIHACLEASERQFQFLLDRFLIALGLLNTERVPQLTLPLESGDDMVALSLPETVRRRRAFLAERPENCAVFDGLRKTPGWIGCGLSYQILALHGLRHQLPSLTVMEDDVVLPSDFAPRYAHIKSYLEARAGQWDVFAGLIAALHQDARVLQVDEVDGVCFVTLDRMTSMVFNIYSPRLMNVLARWDSSNLDATSNTIDRFIENQLDLRVVVTLPFFVGHREDMHSTLWGFKNTQYADMISESERALRERVDAFRLTN